MPKNLSDVQIENDLSPKQERLIVWRDYFKLLKSAPEHEFSDRGVDPEKLYPWLDVIITEIEGDIMHLECGQEEYCRWGDAKDLTQLDGNIDARDD